MRTYGGRLENGDCVVFQRAYNVYGPLAEGRSSWRDRSTENTLAINPRSQMGMAGTNIVVHYRRAWGVQSCFDDMVCYNTKG
jgi:hypothetical protein